MRCQMLFKITQMSGIICVPRHSNPSGEVYSDDNINELFEIGKKYSEDFLFLLIMPTWFMTFFLPRIKYQSGS